MRRGSKHALANCSRRTRHVGPRPHRSAYEGGGCLEPWRDENPDTHPDLVGADLTKANLSGALLSKTRLIAEF